MQALFILVKTNEHLIKQNAGLFLFWQRCGTVTECVMDLPHHNIKIVLRKCPGLLENHSTHAYACEYKKCRTCPTGLAGFSKCLAAGVCWFWFKVLRAEYPLITNSLWPMLIIKDPKSAIYSPFHINNQKRAAPHSPFDHHFQQRTLPVPS